MKKFFVCFALCFCSLASMGQVNFTEYITVPTPPINVPTPSLRGNTYQQPQQQYQQNYQQPTQKQTFPTIGGYYIYNGKLKRIKIRVNGVSNFGQASVYLRSVYDNTYNMWNDCNTQAYKVDEAFDGEYLANNFEWKVSTNFYGTIYFNY